MATSNRRHSMFYRNANVKNSREEAIAELKSANLLNATNDGEGVLSRYMASFKYDSTSHTYVEEDYDQTQQYAFVRSLNTEETTTTTKPYVTGDVIVCGDARYKAIASAAATSLLTDTAKFEAFSASNIQTIRNVLGICTVYDDTPTTGGQSTESGRKMSIFIEQDEIERLVEGATIVSDNGTITIADLVTGGKNIQVNAGTSLKVDDGTTVAANKGKIDVNIDSKTIKQAASGADVNKLYVPLGSGLEYDSTSGNVQARPGKALAFRTGETGASASNNGLIDVQYDDDTIKLDSLTNKLEVSFDTTTMESKGNNSNGEWGVKHGNTVIESNAGIDVNIDGKTLQQVASGADANKIAVNHDTTLVMKTTSSGGTTTYDGLSVNIDAQTIRQYPSNDASNPDKLYVNIDNDTIIYDSTVKVSPAISNLSGTGAIDVINHTTSSVVDGKVVELFIDSSDNVLTQTVTREEGHISTGGLKANITLSDTTSSEASLPSNVLKRYRLIGKNSAQLGDPIDIYKDSSLIDVHLGHIGDTLKPEEQWASGHTTPVYPTDYNVNSSGHDAICFVYQLADESFQLITVDVESYLNEAEFKNGLVVNTSTNEVSARLGDGLEFDTTAVDGQRPIQVKVGAGIQINSTSKSVEAKLTNKGGLVLDGSNAIKVNTATSNPVIVDSTDGAVKHDTSGVTAGSYGADNVSDVTIDANNLSGSIKVPYITVDSFGHITAASERTLSITIPEGKITAHTEPTWETEHVAAALASAIASNKISVGDTVSKAVQNLDNKVAAVEVELNRAEAVLSQAIEDEPRYYAKSTTSGETSATAKTATLVENRTYNLINGTQVDVYFQYEQTTTTGTLNINGTGAKALVYNDELFDTTNIHAGTTLSLVYDSAYNSNAGCYRVVGGVGSGDGNTGLVSLTKGQGTEVVNDYTEVTIATGSTPYSSGWFTGITPAVGTVYRVTSEGNYKNKAYVWDSTNSKYVITDNITQHVNVDLAQYMYNEDGTTAVTGVNNMLKVVNTGTVQNPNYELTLTNTWDCGTY